MTVRSTLMSILVIGLLVVAARRARKEPGSATEVVGPADFGQFDVEARIDRQPVRRTWAHTT